MERRRGKAERNEAEIFRDCSKHNAVLIHPSLRYFGGEGGGVGGSCYYLDIKDTQRDNMNVSGWWGWWVGLRVEGSFGGRIICLRGGEVERWRGGEGGGGVVR